MYIYIYIDDISGRELNGEKYDTKGRFRRREKKDVVNDKLIFSKENIEI